MAQHLNHPYIILCDNLHQFIQLQKYVYNSKKSNYKTEEE